MAEHDEPGRIEIELTTRGSDGASAEIEPLVARPLESPRSSREGRGLMGTAPLPDQLVAVV